MRKNIFTNNWEKIEFLFDLVIVLGYFCIQTSVNCYVRPKLKTKL